MNILYVYDDSQQLQVDPATITLQQGEVTTVTDTQDVDHAGADVTVFTPRDIIHVDDLNISLTVGDEIYLDNQTREKWTVRHGWYAVDGNPPICGWYLESIPVGRVRSLYLKDLDHLTIATTKLGYRLPDIVRG